MRTELECLAVKGNFLDRHPDYKSLILRYFPRLKELNGIQVTEALRQQLKEAGELRGALMHFFYKMD